MLLCDVAMGQTLQTPPGEWTENVKIARYLSEKKASEQQPWDSGDECFVKRDSGGFGGCCWQRARVELVGADGQPVVKFLDHSGEAVGEPIKYTEDKLMPVNLHQTRGHSQGYDASVQDLTGTPFNSLQILSDKAPSEESRIVHPSGAAMPVGKLVPREMNDNVQTSLANADEIIVYSKSQVTQTLRLHWLAFSAADCMRCPGPDMLRGRAVRTDLRR